MERGNERELKMGGASCMIDDGRKRKKNVPTCMCDARASRLLFAFGLREWGGIGEVKGNRDFGDEEALWSSCISGADTVLRTHALIPHVHKHRIEGGPRRMDKAEIPAAPLLKARRGSPASSTKTAATNASAQTTPEPSPSTHEHSSSSSPSSSSSKSSGSGSGSDGMLEEAYQLLVSVRAAGGRFLGVSLQMCFRRAGIPLKQCTS